jgi:hypothetical protein
MTTLSANRSSSNLQELFIALAKAQGDKELTGICLTNDDPEADFNALTEKNRNVLCKYDLYVDHQINRNENGSIEITTRLIHKKSGQYEESNDILQGDINGKPLCKNSPEVFERCRILQEMILGIASSNNAVEADLFGPKRKYRELPTLYDKTADYIDFECFNQDGEVLTKKIDRKKFETIFLGMTSEEEAVTEFKVPEYREFSWSDLKLSLQCRRCFFNAKRTGIRPPVADSEGFALPKAIDQLLKKEFDQYRMRKQQHPIMSGTNIIRPLCHKKLRKWQIAWSAEEKKKFGIQFRNVWENWLAYGGIDDVWINDKKELVVVEYKTLALDRVAQDFSNVPYLEMYKKQVTFYAWLLRKRNYPVCSTGYILFYNAITGGDSFNCKLDFEQLLLEFQIDDSWIQTEIDEALQCLEKKAAPPSASNCRICKYFATLTTMTKPMT